METLLTLPTSFARFIRQNRERFPGIHGVYPDPEGVKLGSAGGTVNVLWHHYLKHSQPGEAGEGFNNRQPGNGFREWLSSGRRLIIHSDGQSRRLPAYAPQGKSFIPFPAFRWARGHNLVQGLLDIQLPFLKQILEQAPAGMNTLVASGDAMVFATEPVPAVPVSDVACVGVWTDAEIATKHGVFICPRSDPGTLSFMVQKPSLSEIQELTVNNLFLLDAGIWLLSDDAVENLFRLCGWGAETDSFRSGMPETFDLYSGFGGMLGKEPLLGENVAAGLKELKTHILTIPGAEFFHFGSNSDLLASTHALQNKVTDQREIWHRKIKPSPDIFVQNSFTGIDFTPANNNIWIDSSHISQGWNLRDHHIITGVPRNDWKLDFPAGICLDFIPVGERDFCIRFYGFYDRFSGSMKEESTLWMNRPASEWFETRGLKPGLVNSCDVQDIYFMDIFPVVASDDITELFLQWLISGQGDQELFRERYQSSRRFSCEAIIRERNHERGLVQTNDNMCRSLSALAANHRHSIFYSLDLKWAAGEFAKNRIPAPAALSGELPLMTKIHDAMFRSLLFSDGDYARFAGGDEDPKHYGVEAFRFLRDGMLAEVNQEKVMPLPGQERDQIIWGRSPVRLDLAGGWTDTPPYCILSGGSVVNLAVELNGQPPLQVFIRPAGRPEIKIHSIDLGVSEVVTEFSDLGNITQVGSPFVIPKAALMLAGFHPRFCSAGFRSLREQLLEYGGGFDLTLMVAVPKGSGLGTSSILASTVLAVLSDMFRLGWDRHAVAFRTLVLEQMLTTGGGWQDQFGGIFEGVKLVESRQGLIQRPTVRWAPDHLFTGREWRDHILLYYTGINRVAKNILSEIVRGMFLNSSGHLEILGAMKQLSLQTYRSIQDHDWQGLTNAIDRSWLLNQRLDRGTNTPEIAAMLKSIEDYMSACKLLGAGGGGYLMIFAKDPGAADRIRMELTSHPPNPAARFVDWRLSGDGLVISRS